MLSDFFEYDFLTYALLSVIFLSLVCGVLSPMVIAKKYAFLGEAVAHSTLLSLAIATCFLNFSGPSLTLAATLITLIIVLPLAWATYHGKIPSDTLIGVFLSASVAIGVLIFYFTPDKSSDLSSFLFGNILLVEKSDVINLAFLCLLIVFIVLFSFKKWIFLIYDEKGAELFGINALFYHFLLIGFLTFLIVSSVKIAGTILVNALLLIPGSIAFKLAKTTKSVFITSVFSAFVLSITSLLSANTFNLPPGPTLAVVHFLALICVIGLSKIRV